MKLPRNLTGRQLARRLTKLGYEIVRQEGSHIRLRTERDGRKPISIPDHAPLKIGTVSAILRDVEAHHRLSRKELLAILFGAGTKR